MENIEGNGAHKRALEALCGLLEGLSAPPDQHHRQAALVLPLLSELPSPPHFVGWIYRVCAVFSDGHAVLRTRGP